MRKITITILIILIVVLTGLAGAEGPMYYVSGLLIGLLGRDSYHNSK